MTRAHCDLLVRNAQVVTMNAQRTIYEPGAIAVEGARIKGFGTHESGCQVVW